MWINELMNIYEVDERKNDYLESELMNKWISRKRINELMNI